MPATSGRLVFLDRVRGLASLLMVLDHALVLSLTLDPGDGLRTDLRSTLTRLSMPLFMVVSGFLLSGSSRRRVLEVAGTAVVLAPMLYVSWAEFAQPEILALWLLLVPLRSLLERYPLELLFAGVLQILHLPVGWPGFEPGLILVFLALGVLARDRPRSLEMLGRALPGWFALVGRYPLTVYAGHLALFAIILVAVRGF